MHAGAPMIENHDVAALRQKVRRQIGLGQATLEPEPDAVAGASPRGQATNATVAAAAAWLGGLTLPALPPLRPFPPLGSDASDKRNQHGGSFPAGASHRNTDAPANLA